MPSPLLQYIFVFTRLLREWSNINCRWWFQAQNHMKLGLRLSLFPSIKCIIFRIPKGLQEPEKQTSNALKLYKFQSYQTIPNEANSGWSGRAHLQDNQCFQPVYGPSFHNCSAPYPSQLHTKIEIEYNPPTSLS